MFLIKVVFLKLCIVAPWCATWGPWDAVDSFISQWNWLKKNSLFNIIVQSADVEG